MSDGPSWSRIADTLGHDFHIARLTLKTHVGCGHVFPAIDGSLALQHKHGVDQKNIRHIHIETYQPALAIACHDDTKTANEARFSLKYMVATALVHRSEEHTSELQSLMSISYEVFRLKTKTLSTHHNYTCTNMLDNLQTNTTL